jgi:hypothetical protein
MSFDQFFTQSMVINLLKKREIKIELIKKYFIWKIYSLIHLNISFNFIFLISIFLINLKFFGIFKVTTKLEIMELQVYLILYLLFLNVLWPVFHSIYGNKFIKKREIKIKLIKKYFIYKIHSRIYLNLSFNFIFLISIS